MEYLESTRKGEVDGEERHTDHPCFLFVSFRFFYSSGSSEVELRGSEIGQLICVC